MPDLEKLVQRLDQIESKLKSMETALGQAEKQWDQYHQLYPEALERCRKSEGGIPSQQSERLTEEDNPPTPQPARESLPS